MTWLDTLTGLSASADRQIRALWQRHDQGRLDRPTFVALAAAVIARNQGRAVMAADLAVATTIARRLRQPASPVGLPVPDDQPRLARAVGTVLDDPVEFEGPELSQSRSDRLARLARAETLNAGQNGTQAAWAAAAVASGWTRKTDADPCPLCIGWADGAVRPWTVRMARHTGCGCLPVPAL